MRIDIRFVGKGKTKWDTDPRLPLIAADVWHFLEGVASGRVKGRFVGELGQEYVKLASGVEVVLSWWRESPTRICIPDIHITKWRINV